MTRTTRKQVQDAIDRLNEIVKKHGSRYCYQFASRYDQKYLETVEIIDEADSSKNKYRGVVVQTKTMRDLLSHIDAIIYVLLDCND